MSNVFSKFSELESKHKAFINLVLKPLLSLIVFLSIGYYTMWLSTNYVRQDQFLKLIDTQNEKFFQQENKTKNQFDNVQNKLEIIINQQTIFNEQIKTFNTLLANYQKQYDNLYERVLYLERTRKDQR